LNYEHFTNIGFRGKGHHLKVLDIRGAKEFTLRGFIALGQACPLLEYLNLSACPKLTHVAGAATFSLFGTPSQFIVVTMNSLKRLIASHCENLQEVHLKVPELQCLEAQACSSLLTMNLEAPVLQIMSLSAKVDAKECAEVYKDDPTLFARSMSEESRGNYLKIGAACLEKIVYPKFLNGVLVYRPQEGSDVGRIDMPIAALSNPLEGTFDLSRCGDAGKYLSISTGYRKTVKLENTNKLEIWIAPRFLIKRALATTAGHFREIEGIWASSAEIGIFWNCGDYDNLTWYDYLISQDIDNLSKNNLYVNWTYASAGALANDKRLVSGADDTLRVSIRLLKNFNCIFTVDGSTQTSSSKTPGDIDWTQVFNSLSSSSRHLSQLAHLQR